ncbi:MAG TPA: helix-turn-helix domain-containing protein, partial [Ramlibacter sp.]|nr:helix-turn-helix domain-containing protein [Ramlibacter sp.]
GSELAVTHEFVGSMLGVRRESITEDAHRLQNRGLIHAHRGHIEVVDRAGLENAACECAAVVKRQYELLLPGS